MIIIMMWNGNVVNGEAGTCLVTDKSGGVW